MANIINNTIMNYSLPWPGSAEGVAGGTKTGEAATGQQIPPRLNST